MRDINKRVLIFPSQEAAYVMLCHDMSWPPPTPLHLYTRLTAYKIDSAVFRLKTHLIFSGRLVGPPILPCFVQGGEKLYIR